jgi:hypothetical protein
VIAYFCCKEVVRIDMELLLNILGMLIVMGLLGTWRTRWVHQRRRSSRRSLQEWSALSVALVLLFFAVSMTDDMHSGIAALEECSASKRDLTCSPAAHALPQSGMALHSSCWAVVPPVPVFGPSSPHQKLEPTAQLRSSVLSSNRASGRAPPVLFL